MCKKNSSTSRSGLRCQVFVAQARDRVHPAEPDDVIVLRAHVLVEMQQIGSHLLVGDRTHAAVPGQGLERGFTHELVGRGVLDHSLQQRSIAIEGADQDLVKRLGDRVSENQLDRLAVAGQSAKSRKGTLLLHFRQHVEDEEERIFRALRPDAAVGASVQQLDEPGTGFVPMLQRPGHRVHGQDAVRRFRELADRVVDSHDGPFVRHRRHPPQLRSSTPNQFSVPSLRSSASS